jgi:uncharacterized membrane protein YdbT with pleckstrin-like domain
MAQFTMRLLSILTETKNSFSEMKSYEKVVLVLYRHEFVLALQLLGHLIILIIMTSAAIFLSGYFTAGSIITAVWLIYFIFILYWWMTMFYLITMYLLDIWVVTDHRIIDSQQHGFFSRTVSEASLARIEDVSVEIRGLIPTFLNYGDVEVQTAGANHKFVFKQIKDPQGVKDTIMRLASQYLHTHVNGEETCKE